MLNQIFSDLKSNCISHSSPNAFEANPAILYSSTDEAQFLKIVKEKNPNIYRGAKAAFAPETILRLNSQITINDMYGIFETYHNFHIKKAIDAKIDRAKDEYGNLRAETFKTVNSFENSYNAFKDAKEKEFSTIKSGNETTLKEFNTQFSDFMDDSKLKRIELEKLYNEKLALSEPIEYWKKIKKGYHKVALIASIISCLIAGVLVFLLIKILYNNPSSIFSADTLTLGTLKGTLLLVSIISICFYVLHLVVKYCFGSLHLARDAAERQQLTYVYLALCQREEFKNDDKSRDIILNSLFSRSDSGLLKGHRSPSLPLEFLRGDK